MTPTRIATGLVVVAVLASPRAFADRGAEAQALFDQGIADFKAGKLDQACPELAASLAKHDDTGTKGALAVCEQSRGRVATSWKLWRDLSDTATDPTDRDDARAHATALEPRLPRYVIHTAASPVGLVVSINGVEADPSITTPLPIDPGPLVVVAHTTGRVEWTHTFDAAEGQLVAIDVPELAVIAQPPPVTPPTVVTRQPVGPAISATPTLDHAPSALRFDIGASVAFYDAPADFSTSPDTALGIEAAVGYRFTHALSGVVMTNVDLVLGDASFERGFAGAGLELSHGAIAGRLGAGLAFLTGRDETLTGLGVDATAFVGLTRSLALVLDGELAFTGQAPGLMGTFSALRLGVGIAYRPR